MNKKTNNKLITDKIRKKLLLEKNNLVTSRTSSLKKGVGEKILEDIKNKYKLNDSGEALAVITVLFQQGGTARSCDGNMTIRLFDKEFKLSEIRKILKQNSCNRAERKLARAFATDIYEAALALELDGNLFPKIRNFDLSISYSLEDRVWMSDFQSDNEDCPARIRTLILETFKKKTTRRK